MRGDSLLHPPGRYFLLSVDTADLAADLHQWPRTIDVLVFLLGLLCFSTCRCIEPLNLT